MSKKFTAGLQPKTVEVEKKYKYYYISGGIISKTMFEKLVKRFKLSGDKVLDGKFTVAYRMGR